MIWYSPRSWMKALLGGLTVREAVNAYATKSDPTYGIMAQFYTPGQPIWSDRNYHAFTTEGYKKCGAVYACVQKIAGGASGIKWKLYTDESMQRQIPDHDLLRLWKKPNPGMGTAELIEQVFGFWHLAGNSYLYANRPYQNQPPAELWPLYPDQMKVVAGNNDIQGYVYGYGTPNPRIYELEDIMHLRFASYDERSYYGLSPLEVAMRKVDSLNTSAEYGVALKQNYGSPSALFALKNGYLTTEQRDQVKKELKKKFSGKRNAGMPLVLEADMSYTQMGLSPKEMDWLASDQIDERGICMILDVPSILLSDYEGATYANRKEAKQSLFTENILPKMDRTVGHINMWLVPMYEDLRRMGAYFSYDPKDIEVLAELYTAVEQQLTEKATNGWNNGLYDMATAQELQGVKVDKNGKGIYKLGPGILVRSEDLGAFAQACLEKVGAPPPAPLMMHPAGQQQLPPPKPNTVVTEVPDDNNNSDDTDSTGNGNSNSSDDAKYVSQPAYYQTKILDLTTKEEKAAYMQQLEEQRATWENEIESRMQKYFKSEQSLMTKALETCSTEQQAENVTDNILAANDDLKQLIYNIWYDVGSHFSKETAKQLQQKKETLADIFSSKIIQWLLNLSSTKVTQITDTTRNQLRKALADGVAQGESISEIAKRIDGLYLDDIIPNRSRVIAQTETLAASNWSAVESAKESGLTLNKVWLATEDKHTRPTHTEADGQEVGMDEKFVVGDVEMDQPGDSSAPASEVVNCRCTVYFKRVQDNEEDSDQNETAINHTLMIYGRRKNVYRQFMEAYV